MNSKKDLLSLEQNTTGKIHEDSFLEEKNSNRLKRSLTVVIAFLLILLIVSYVFASFGLGNILIGLLQSEKIEENKVRINETSYLIFKGNCYSKLLRNYLKNEAKEFKACLIGKNIGNDYEITEIIIPKMLYQSFNQVVSEKCPLGTIADLHSQPYRHCIESSQDLKTKRFIHRTDPSRIMIIMCEKERFTFY